MHLLQTRSKSGVKKEEIAIAKSKFGLLISHWGLLLSNTVYYLLPDTF